MPRKRKPTQKTIADLLALQQPETSPLVVEWFDENGVHNAPVTGIWDSETGATVLTAVKENTRSQGDAKDA